MGSTGWLLILGVFVVASAVGAACLAASATSSLRQGVSRAARREPLVRAAVRGTAARSAFVLATTAGAIVIVAVLASMAGRLNPDSGYVLPMVAAIVGLLSHTAVRSPRRMAATETSYASLEPRRARDFLPRTWLFAPPILAVLFAATTITAALSPSPSVAYRGLGAAAAITLAATVALTARFALWRLTLLPSMAVPAEAADAARRQVAARLLVLVASWALLTSTALVALQAGVWLWTVGATVAAGATAATAITYGIALTLMGVASTLGTFATGLAAITGTLATMLRSVSREQLRVTRSRRITP